MSETMGPAMALQVSGVIAVLATAAAVAALLRIRVARRAAQRWTQHEPVPALT
jgi:hypothetical protein